MSRSKFSTLAIVIALTAPGVARAQEEGVFVDPDSSSAKEYAIPLEESRRKGSTGKNDKPVKQGSRSAPAFGEGVSPDDDAATPTAGGGGGSSAGGGSGGSGSPASDGTGGGSGASTPAGADGGAAVERAEELLRRDQTLASSDDLDGTTVTILAGGGVLLVAAFAGIALRRLRGNG